MAIKKERIAKFWRTQNRKKKNTAIQQAFKIIKGWSRGSPLFWECPPQGVYVRKAQLLNILNLKSSSAERKNFSKTE
jgi:hypothetical protein